MSKRTDGRARQTRHVCFLPLSSSFCRRVSTSQYPIRPIRKYSRGVICRGRRCPIGRHRFSQRRAPHFCTVVARAAPWLRARDIPRLRRRVSCTIASDPISFVRRSIVSPPSQSTETHTTKNIIHTRRIRLYIKLEYCVIRHIGQTHGTKYILHRRKLVTSRLILSRNIIIKFGIF